MSDTTATTSNRSLITAILAAIGSATCCAGPLILLGLGVSGSWIGNLSALEPYRPIFIGITLLFLGLAFRKLYLVPQSCAVEVPCATPSNLKKQRIAFWIISIAAMTMMLFPWYAPLLLD